MMRTATWGLAVLIDVLGMLMGVVYLSGGLEHGPLLFWGAAVPGIFSALCLAVPAVALLGSLDAGTISGHEWFAMFIAGLAGVLNWVAVRGRVRSPLWLRQ